MPAENTRTVERADISLHAAFAMYRYAVQRLMPPDASTANHGEEAHAILTSRSDIEEALQRGESLSEAEKTELGELDERVRANAATIIAAEDNYAGQRKRLRYPRSHWWWFLENEPTDENARSLTLQIDVHM